MRRASVLLLACALLPSPGLADPSAPDLRISEVLPDPDTAAGQREFVELWNAGNATLDLAGWTLSDAPTSTGAVHTYTFPAWSLAPGRRVVLWGGGTADGTGLVWSDSAVWNNAGDGIHLRDPDDELAGYVGYGSTTPPTGFPVQPKPAKGQSLEIEGGTWRAGRPTPGSAPGAIAGTLSMAVANLPPTATWTGLPASARHGTEIGVAFTVDDPNGPTDVAGWTLQAGGIQVAAGATAGPQTARFAAPATGSEATLLLSVRDTAGATANATALLPLRDSDLGVGFPDGPVRFAAQPGAGQVAAAGRLRLDNAAAAAIVPLLDVSPFRADGHTVAPEGRLMLGWLEGGTLAWHRYDGPLTPLAPIPPGGSLEIELRLDGIPTAIPAGTYGASFTVVPA